MILQIKVEEKSLSSIQKIGQKYKNRNIIVSILYQTAQNGTSCVVVSLLCTDLFELICLKKCYKNLVDGKNVFFNVLLMIKFIHLIIASCSPLHLINLLVHLSSMVCLSNCVLGTADRLFVRVLREIPDTNFIEDLKIRGRDQYDGSQSRGVDANRTLI